MLSVLLCYTIFFIATYKIPQCYFIWSNLVFSIHTCARVLGKGALHFPHTHEVYDGIKHTMYYWMVNLFYRALEGQVEPEVHFSKFSFCMFIFFTTFTGNCPTLTWQHEHVLLNKNYSLISMSFMNCLVILLATIWYPICYQRLMLISDSLWFMKYEVKYIPFMLLVLLGHAFSWKVKKKSCEPILNSSVIWCFKNSSLLRL